MPTVLEISEQFRADLIAREIAAERELAIAYRQVRRELEDYLDRLTEEIARAERFGLEPTPDQLFNQARTFTMLEQIEDEVERIARGLEPTIERMKSEAVELGDELAVRLLGAEGVPVRMRLPNDALREAVSRLRRGSPVDDLLAQLGPDAAAQVRSKLLAGVTAGWGPGTVALEISNALGANLARAMTIARTEMIQAYRNAALLNYRRFPNLIQGWIWTAAVASSPGPCPVCLALHGRVFPLGRPFGSHPRCRCGPAPLTRGSRVPFPAGDEWLAEQPAAIQQEILGPMGYLAYIDGAVELSDFAELVDDPVWGPQWRKRALSDILGARQLDRIWAMLRAA